MKKILSCILILLLLVTSLQTLAFAEVPIVSLTFEDEKSIDVSSPKKATLIAPDTLQKAEFYIENVLIYTLEGDMSSEYNFELDLQNSPVLGETNIVVKAFCPEETEISIPVNLVRYKAETTVFTENFNSFTSGTWPTSVHGYIESANGAYVNQMGPYVHAEGDTALKITFPEVYNKSSTYMEKDNLGISTTCVTNIKFDAYFATEGEYMRVELRDTNGGYPKYEGSGVGSIAIFDKDGVLYGGGTYSPETWYSVLIELDLTTPQNSNERGAWIYIKGGEYADYTLISYLPGFYSDGLKKIRFTCSSAGGNNGYTLIDNFEITKREFMKKWYFTAEYEDENGNATAFDSVKTTGAKAVLKFSEDMGENLNGKVIVKNEMGDSIAFSGSYNQELNTYTIEINDTLLNGGKYAITVEEGVASAAGNGANSTLGTVFYAEEYPVSVKSLSYSDGTATAEIENADLVSGNMALVIAVYSGDKCVDSNMVLLTNGTETYNLALSKESDNTICAYIIDSLATLKMLSIYNK